MGRKGSCNLKRTRCERVSLQDVRDEAEAQRAWRGGGEARRSGSGKMKGVAALVRAGSSAATRVWIIQ